MTTPNTTLNTPAHYKQSIATLLKQAETRFVADTKITDADAGIPAGRLPNYMQGLDLVLSEEVLLSLRQEFLHHAGVFDNARSRAAIYQAVSETTKTLVEAWLQENMANITREVVGDALAEITDVRPAAFAPSQNISLKE